MKSKIVLDSSAWIEILREGPLKSSCEKYLGVQYEVIVPTTVIFEVYRKIARSHPLDEALGVATLMSQYVVADLTRDIALAAADVSINLGLAMADSYVLSHAITSGATLVTLDNDFAKVSNAKVVR